MQTKIALVIVMLLLCGCAVRTQEEIYALDYGPYPDNYQELVKKCAFGHLIDPYSAYYEFQGLPTQQYKGAGLLADEAYGWGGVVAINAKNRLGGYAGRAYFQYIIRYGNVIWFIQVG